MLLRFK